MSNLKFNENKQFKIVQFTDIHWQDGCAKDKKTEKCMKLILEIEKPDFVAVTGDAVYGEKNIEELRNALKPIIDAKIPFSVCFGNHDAEFANTNQDLSNELQTFENCLIKDNEEDIDGTANHVINLCDGDEVKWSFFFIDSLDYNDNKEIGGYEYIKPSQIKWFKDKTNEIKAGNKNANSLAFFHIALPEYNDVWAYEECFGLKRENVCCPRQNSGMFSAMLEVSNVKGVFVGHDHINDFYGNLKGINLCFGRGTGYNTYGRRGYKRGARVIELSMDDNTKFDTWLRLDDGSIDKQEIVHKPKGMTKKDFD